MKRFEDYARGLANENLDKYTSFKIGGPAEFVLFPKDEGGLIECLKILKHDNIPYIILGNGTNVLVSDEGFKGAVIILRNTLNSISIDGNIVTAGAGATLRDVANFILENSLTGFEFAHGIPGTVGGGVIMNAGAYDGELKNVVRSVRLLDNDLNIRTFSNEEMLFGYRKSIAQDKNYIILSAEFELQEGDKALIKEKMDDFWNRRVTKQPLDMPSAGSTFRRPEGYFAGKLIDDSGLRGFRHGNCGISEKHCGFVVNYGGATAKEVKETIEIVQKVVFDNFGVLLKREVKFIGD